MAYNYFPVGYQPYQFPAQPVQPVQQTPPSTILWVRNGQEAAMYPVAPNNAVALWDSSAPVIYLKQADASGKPTMKTFDLVERVETPVESVSEKEIKDTYATKNDLAAVVSLVKTIEDKVAQLQDRREED